MRKAGQTRAWILAVLLGLAVSGPGQAIDLRLTEVATGVVSLVDIVNAGDGSNRLYLVGKGGVVRVFENGALRNQPFMSLTGLASDGMEQGLLSIAFPPDYPTRREVYVYYTDLGGAGLLSRFQVDASGLAVIADSQEVVLAVAQPNINHNGGKLLFGPDGYLYLSLGDGGGSGDPDGSGQNLSTLLGKIIRIDVLGDSQPYGIPPDNPFVGQAGRRGEIWAYGLRNPWRMDFDPLTGDLYIADVGQSAREEVNFQPANSPGGENYGWNRFEGAVCFAGPCGSTAGITMPIFEYPRSSGCSISGGVVYRGSKYPALDGTYLYSDFCSGRIWGTRRVGSGFETTELRGPGFSIVSFGRDERGNVYVGDFLASRLLLLSDGPPIDDDPLEPEGFPIQPGLSGAWYDPEQSGQGVLLEVLDNQFIFATWFTYRPEGGQAWIVAQGEHQGDRAELPAFLPEGARFLPNFRAEDVTLTPWGSWTLRFEDCNNGVLEYQSTAGFGSGELRLARLTTIGGLACAP